jgi:ABC-type phosphate transport system substrate-binding protein
MASSARQPADSAKGAQRVRTLVVSGLSALVMMMPLTALLVVLSPQVASAVAPVPINGTGSSFASPALRQWAAQTDGVNGVQINFTPSSSVQGMNEYAQGLVNFAASDIGYSTGQANYTPGGAQVPFQYMPDVGGALCMAYNLDSPAGQAITNLRLDPQTLLKIFSGQIQFWDDAQIAGLNPGVPLPHYQIIANVRSDGAGESYILSDYFYTLYQSQWNAFTNAMGAASGPNAIWPSAPVNANQIGPYNISQLPAWSGSDAVIEHTKDDNGASNNTNNSITYVETAYAQLNNLPCASLLNPAGQWVQPSEEGDAIALTQDQLEPDLEQILTGVFLNSNPLSYPISAYSYLITQEAQTPAAVGVVLADYVKFIACQGQQSAGPLGYTPIPPNLVQDDFDAINRINQGGAPPLPPANAANCPNPYLTGQLQLPGEPIQIGTPGASGTTTGTSTTIPGSGTTGPGAGAGASGAAGSAASTSNAAIQAEIAAAQKKAEEVAQASKKLAGNVQTPGTALTSLTDRLLGRPFSSGLIWLWTLLLVGVFAIVPAAIAVLGKRRRLRTSAEEVDE